MSGQRIRLYLVILTIVLVILALIAESVYFSDFEYRVRTKKFNKILATKETVTENCLNSIKTLLDSGENIGSINRNDLFPIIRSQGITLLEYLDNKLSYWSDNSFDVPPSYEDSLFMKPLIFIQNGWFLTKSVRSGNERMIALLRLRNDFGFENDIVKNGFVSVYGVPEGTEMSFNRKDQEFRVFNKEGQWLFSLIYPEVKKLSYFAVIPLALWSLVFILILLLVFETARSLAARGSNILALSSSLLIFMLIYGLILVARKPSILYETEIFTAYQFSLNRLIPSLGHLLIFSILVSLYSFQLYKFFPIHKPSAGKPFPAWLLLSFLLMIGASLMLFYHQIFRELISNSNISFEPFKVLDLSVYSLIGFLSLIFLVLVPVFFMLKVFSVTQQLKPVVVILSIATSLLVFAVARFIEAKHYILLSSFYLFLAVLMWLVFKSRIAKFTMTVLFSCLFGLYSLYYIIVLSEKKDTENKKVLAVSYSSENDPEAEQLLLDLWPRLSADTVLRNMMSVELSGQTEVDNITAYLHETYFNGYWGNFNLYVVTCRNDSPLWIPAEENLALNCFDFFNEKIRKDGHQLTGTDFYFLDNQGGRSYYTGRLFFKLKNKMSNGLFIDLYSDVDAFQPGYSELLLDKKYQGFINLKDKSFAKYINGNLVLRTGDFPYDKTDAEYIGKEYDYRIFTREGFRHVLYKNGNITVIISEPVLSAVDILISFAYLFAFILLITNLLLIFINKPDLKTIFNFNFRQKLQISFIGILLFSFISVGTVIAFFSIRQYQSRHLETIKEKINSIYTELENKLSLESHLTSDWRDTGDASLNELLIKLSNIFNTDINLYDKNGYLLATSRPEVFQRDLTSRRINNDAFLNLETLTKSEYIQRERIASLEYRSAYVPFYNDNAQLLAYLNLPYFRMQSVLAREISNVIVAVVNFTVLLIVLTMSFAVIISGRLTSPLRMLSSGLASVKLGSKSEHLSYQGHDEIGDMVKQYNIMVDELQESALKLANSEREYAWREMAKQVAHEIKNPLTPMKLNIQQLYKSWQDGIPGFERKLERFTKNQIEYIETLSSIASAFSSFAKMPGANPVELDLLEQLKTTLELFKSTDNLAFRVNWPHQSRIMVYVDKEHLNGIFANLIKNAIQSLPPGREGVIKIGMELKGDKVVVSISDNGMGIPDSLKKNLFIPNFTTKSSGMGLGLSIVKRYVESANGRVWFESQINKGSVFFVELPVIFTVERLG